MPSNSYIDSAGRFFQSCGRALVGHPPTLANRKSQTNNALAEVTAQSLAQITPVPAIPVKTAQVLNSLSMLFSNEINTREKLIHGLQASLAAAQAGLSLYMLLQGVERCEDLGNLCCRYTMAAQLFYNGILLSGFLTDVPPKTAVQDVHVQEDHVQEDHVQQAKLN